MDRSTLWTAQWISLCLLGLGILSSCSVLQPGADPGRGLGAGIAPSPTPSWAREKLGSQWWQVFQDEQLNSDVAVALEHSPQIASLTAQLKKAEAELSSARAMAWPRLNLGFGYRPGRALEVDFGPYNQAPWTSSAQFDWEIDLWGRLETLRNSAEEGRDAKFFDRQAAELLLSSRLAESRFRIYRLEEEYRLLLASQRAQSKIVEVLKDKEAAGLIAESETLRAKSQEETLRRGVREIERLRGQAQIELKALRGRSGTLETDGDLPELPPIPARSFEELLACHPSLLAAESKVRQAFGIEEAARLSLLPSIRLKGSAMGRASGFLLQDFRAWELAAGPTLDLPVFDPGRLATWKQKKAEVKVAAEQYRAALIEVLREIESSYLDLGNRQSQLASIRREVDSYRKAQENEENNFRAGVVSSIEVLSAKQDALAAERTFVVVYHSLLSDYVRLVRSLGGGV